MIIKPKAHYEETKTTRKAKPSTGLIDLAVTGLDPDALPDLEEFKTVNADSATEHKIVRTDDIWQLGEHRLACGDSTSPDVVARLLRGERPHLMVTDPPYGVIYEADWRNQALGGNEGGRAVGIVENDSKCDWREAWALFPGDVAYVWHADKTAYDVYASLTAANFEIRSHVIWGKSRFVLGRGHYHPQHETCYYAVRKGKTGHWNGDHSQSTLWEINHIKSESGHSTQKPIECMKRPIENNSKEGDAVYEPFCGSGTTIIAAEMTKRRCFAIELNPLYVYIAINRWQMFTGKLATLEETGETFTEVLLRRLKEPQRLDVVARAEEKQEQRDKDQQMLESGEITKEELQEKNNFFASLDVENSKIVSIGKKPTTIATPPARRFTVSTPQRKAPLEDPFLVYHAETLRAAAGAQLRFDEGEWVNEAQAAVGVDVECYQNFFLVCFKRFDNGKRITFELSERSELDRKTLSDVVTKNKLISFNGISYDIPMIFLALRGATCSELKAASDRLVSGSIRHWEVEKELKITIPRLNHIDLFEPNPSIRQSLKILAGRLHQRFLVDLPYQPSTHLTHEQMNVTTLYCFNDIDATQLVYNAMCEPLDLRVALSREYKIDLRSKSDAQMGEAIVKKRVETALNRRLGKPDLNVPPFQYNIPDFLQFNNEQINGVLDGLRNTLLTVDGAGKLVTPPILDDVNIKIGNNVYGMGIGGLHSQEANRALHSNDEYRLIEIDVKSQYPNIILKLGIYPKSIGPEFLNIYGQIVNERVTAKDSGDTVKADGYKIASNGVWGKTSSPHSFLYSPPLAVSVTITGQLSVLMLVEWAEQNGIEVVSANTDGVIFYCRRSQEAELDDLIQQWEQTTGFTIEKNYYKSIYNSSVNTYIAIKENGKSKRKGPIADPWSEGDLRGQMSKNPQMTVCSEAVLQYALNGTPLEDTIRACTDPRMFVTIIKVATGGMWRGTPLGRAVRYYWSKDGDPIMTADGARRVAKTEGARPLMELTDALPNDINYQRYHDEAQRLAKDLAVIQDQGLL